MDDMVLPDVLGAGDKSADVIRSNATLENLEDVEVSADDVPGIGVLKCELSSSILYVDAGNCWEFSDRGVGSCFIVRGQTY